MSGERLDTASLSYDVAQLVSRLAALAAELHTDELKTLVYVGERLLFGQKKFGILRENHAGKDWVREALEEAADLAVYTTAQLVKVTSATQPHDPTTGPRIPEMIIPKVRWKVRPPDGPHDVKVTWASEDRLYRARCTCGEASDASLDRHSPERWREVHVKGIAQMIPRRTAHATTHGREMGGLWCYYCTCAPGKALSGPLSYDEVRAAEAAHIERAQKGEW